jgi:hypothetical protein
VNNSSKCKLATFLLLVVLLCSAVSYMVVRWTAPTANWQHDQAHGHEWLRDEIGLNDEEFAAINHFEAGYQQQRADLLLDFKAEMNDLQALLLNKDEFSAELQHAIHDLHAVHGELQELSIRHYFDMLGALPADKREHLRQIAAKALSQPE